MIFSQILLKNVHKTVKKHFPNVNLKTDAWVYKFPRSHWEFHGPGKFYTHFEAEDAREARAKGWLKWLKSKGITEAEDV